MKTFIALLISLLMPFSAIAEPLEGKVSKTAVGDGASQQSNSDYERGLIKGEGAGSATEQSQIDLQAPRLSGQAEHGEIPIGVLGCQILTTLFGGHSALIVRIYPGSDLIRAGVKPGDKIVGINGHRFVRKSFPAECRGSPGTMIDLFIQRKGQEVEVQVVRKDARMFAPYEHYFRKWADQTKYW